jgi:hypothetical protein
MVRINLTNSNYVGVLELGHEQEFHSLLGQRKNVAVF